MPEHTFTPLVPIPPKARTWIIFREGSRVRLSAPGPDGVSRTEWPVELLTLDNVMTAFGPGEYRFQFFAADHASRGRSQMIQISAPQRPEPAPVEAVEPPPPPATAGPPDEFTRTLQQMQAISQMTAQQNTQMFQGMAAMMQMVMSGGANQQQNAIVGQLMEQNRLLAQQNAELARRVADLEDEDEDEDESDDDAPLAEGGTAAVNGAAAAAFRESHG